MSPLPRRPATMGLLRGPGGLAPARRGSAKRKDVPVSTPAAASQPVCFARSRPATPAPAVDASALPSDVAVALSNALPFLRCGEESAVHAFGRRLASAADGAEQAALEAITTDEARHAAWLEALAAALPAPDTAPEAGAMAAFFRRLLTRDPALHFARVAALDLSVCALLRPLVARRGVLASAPQVLAGLRLIRLDEARHVRVARDCARRLGLNPRRQSELDRALRDDLTKLLAPVRSSLGRLGILEFGSADASHDAGLVA